MGKLVRFLAIMGASAALERIKAKLAPGEKPHPFLDIAQDLISGLVAGDLLTLSTPVPLSADIPPADGGTK